MTGKPSGVYLTPDTIFTSKIVLLFESAITSPVLKLSASFTTNVLFNLSFVDSAFLTRYAPVSKAESKTGFTLENDALAFE